MREHLGRDLAAAMKARDTVVVAALRSACAAIDNAGAVTVVTPARPAPHSDHVAGAVAGLGATEATRRPVSDTDARVLLQGQIDERSSAADGYDGTGRRDRADRLRAEADVLRRYPDTPG